MMIRTTTDDTNNINDNNDEDENQHRQRSSREKDKSKNVDKNKNKKRTKFSVEPYSRVGRNGSTKASKEEFEELRRAIGKIFENETRDLSFEDLSSSVYEFVLRNEREFLFEEITREIEQRTSVLRERLGIESERVFDDDDDCDDDEEECAFISRKGVDARVRFLKYATDSFREFEKHLDIIRDVFMHMERKKIGDYSDDYNNYYRMNGENELKRETSAASATTIAATLGVKSLGREIFSTNVFGTPDKQIRNPSTLLRSASTRNSRLEDIVVEVEDNNLTLKVQKAVTDLLAKERKDMQEEVIKEEEINTVVRAAIDDDGENSTAVNNNQKQQRQQSSSSSSIEEKIASLERKNVIKRVAEMFWTLSARANECGYADIYKVIIDQKFLRDVDALYTDYSMSIAESSRDCSQYLRRCKLLLKREKQLVVETTASKSNTSKMIIRVIQNKMFDKTSKAREFAFEKGFFDLIIKDEKSHNRGIKQRPPAMFKRHHPVNNFSGVVGDEEVYDEKKLVGMGGQRFMHSSDDAEEESRYADVRLAYDMFGRLVDCDGHDILRVALYSRVEDLGKCIVEHERDPIKFVQAMIQLKNKTDAVIKKGFRDDKTFTNRATQAFEHFLNQNKRSSEYLSLYLDDYLRGNLNKANAIDMEMDNGQQQLKNNKNTEKNTTTTEIWKEVGRTTVVTTSDAAVDACVQIFRFLREKDYFEHFYQLHLSKRLLASKSVSDDSSERDVVSKLKLECGYQYAQKMEVMLNDVSLSKAISRKFNELVEEGKRDGEARQKLVQSMNSQYISTADGGSSQQKRLQTREPKMIMSNERFEDLTKNIELNVKVLTTGSWPLLKLSKVPFPKNLPSTCVDIQKLFVQHYEANYGARRIAWRADCGTAELKVQFKSGEKLLVVSTMQMCILEVFNDTEAVTLRQFAKILGVDIDSCAKALHGLALAKNKTNVLIYTSVAGGATTAQQPATSGITTDSTQNVKILKDDVFMFNDNFQSKHYRVKIATGSTAKKETIEEAKLTAESIREDRKPEIEATIVRILKAKRKIEHNALIAEVTVALQNRFHCDPGETKRRIERLIDLEYIARDDKDRRIYRYLS
jgi:hypothetical protein